MFSFILIFATKIKLSVFLFLSLFTLKISLAEVFNNLFSIKYLF